MKIVKQIQGDMCKWMDEQATCNNRNNNVCQAIRFWRKIPKLFFSHVSNKLCEGSKGAVDDKNTCQFNAFHKF